ncbi:hypothetical protein [uncultured Flavobacterium sp.]|uniref:hypothetical protein n=1 Tax=uncultured Flavobacterium sp. TaxID=165435 RepID=UPI0030C85B6C
MCKIVLFIFVLFLATPTIVSAIDKTIDTSYFFNMSEEESHSSFNEVKSMPMIYSIPLIIDFEGFQRAKYSVLNDRKVNSLKPKVFLPPPELV